MTQLGLTSNSTTELSNYNLFNLHVSSSLFIIGKGVLVASDASARADRTKVFNAAKTLTVVSLVVDNLPNDHITLQLYCHSCQMCKDFKLAQTSCKLGIPVFLMSLILSYICNPY